MAFGENTVNDVVTGYGLIEIAVWWLVIYIHTVIEKKGGGGGGENAYTDPVD